MASFVKRKAGHKIGPIAHGTFHKWLGKSEGEPITAADIANGKAAGGHPAKMAQFAENAKHFSHKRVTKRKSK